MPTITTGDGTVIFYKDWGRRGSRSCSATAGRLNADARDDISRVLQLADMRSFHVYPPPRGADLITVGPGR